MVNWEGAELCYYFDGESHSFDLSDVQFACIAKLLGLQLGREGVKCYSDETLKQFMNMKGNPLKL